MLAFELPTQQITHYSTSVFCFHPLCQITTFFWVDYNLSCKRAKFDLLDLYLSDRIGLAH